jgi:hypothetical protein
MLEVTRLTINTR